MNKKFNYLKQILVDLDKFRKKPATLIAARTFFEQKEYAWAIKELKDYMEIPYKIKVLSDKNLQAPGAFEKRYPFPQGKELENYTFKIFINPEMFESFETFVAVMSHELSHLLLYSYDNGKGHKLSPTILIDSNREIEKATDITAIIIGFGNFIREGRKTIKRDNFGFPVGGQTLGYLSDEEFDFIYDCFINDRRFRKIVRTKNKPS